MAHDVLISYSSKDSLQADAVCNRLETQGIHCWIAPRDVPLGTEYADSIVQAIEDARVMVLIFSSNADQSHQVRREVERAVSKGLTIVPIRIEDVGMSKSFELYVSSMHWLDAVTPPLEKHIDKLAADLKTLFSKDRETPLTETAQQTTARGHFTEPSRPAEPGRNVSEEKGGHPVRYVLLGVAALVLVGTAAGLGLFGTRWALFGTDSGVASSTNASIRALSPAEIIEEPGNRLKIQGVWFDGTKELIAYSGTSTNSSKKMRIMKLYDLKEEKVIYEMESDSFPSGVFRNDGSFVYSDGRNATIYDSAFVAQQTIPNCNKLTRRPAQSHQLMKRLVCLDNDRIWIYKRSDDRFEDPVAQEINSTHVIYGGFAISESEQWIAVGGGYETSATVIIDVDKGKVAELIAPPGKNGSYSPVFFSGDSYVAVGGYGRISIFRTTDWSHVKTIPAFRRTVDTVDVSPDGRYLAAGGLDDLVNVYDTKSWDVVTQYDIGHSIESLRFANTMDYLVVSTNAPRDEKAKIVILKIGLEPSG